MIVFNRELEFNGKNGTSFENYMFATTDKHIYRHVDFSDMEITIMCQGKKKTFKGDQVATSDGREQAMMFFHKIMQGYMQIDITKEAYKLHMCLIYIGITDDGDDVRDDWYSDYVELKKHVLEFSRVCNKAVAMSTHFHQTANDGSGDISAPHVHIIYNSTDNADELHDFLYK